MAFATWCTSTGRALQIRDAARCVCRLSTVHHTFQSRRRPLGPNRAPLAATTRPRKANSSESLHMKSGIDLAQPDRVDGDPVQHVVEDMVGGPLVRIAVDVLIQAAEACEHEADDLVQNWEGFDTGSSASDRLFARATEIRGHAVEISRLVAPLPAPPAVTHTGENG